MLGHPVRGREVEHPMSALCKIVKIAQNRQSRQQSQQNNYKIIGFVHCTQKNKTIVLFHQTGQLLYRILS